MNENRVSKHWALARFGVRFRNEDIAQVATAMRGLDDPVVDLFQRLDDTIAEQIADGGRASLHTIRDSRELRSNLFGPGVKL